jgi:hypothetical protein
MRSHTPAFLWQATMKTRRVCVQPPRGCGFNEQPNVAQIVRVLLLLDQTEHALFRR